MVRTAGGADVCGFARTYVQEVTNRSVDSGAVTQRKSWTYSAEVLASNRTFVQSGQSGHEFAQSDSPRRAHDQAERGARAGCRARRSRSRSRPNSSSTSRKISHPGDDRRRPVGMQARHLAALGQRHRRQLAEDPLAPRRASAGSRAPGGVIGIQPLGDRRQRGGGAGHARSRARRPRRRSAGTAAAMIAAHVGGQLVAARPRSAGSACRWRSVWRTTPAWVETWKLDLVPGRRSPSRSSRRRCRARASASRRRGRARWSRRGRSAAPPRRR